MTMTTTSMSSVLDEVVSAAATFEIADDYYLAGAIGSMRPTKRRRDRHAGLSGLTAWSTKTEGSNPDDDAMANEFTKDLVQRAIGKRIQITRELVDFAEFDTVPMVGKDLGATYRYTLERDFTEIFRGAFATTNHSIPDNGTSTAALCAATHTWLGGTTYANRGTTALSHQAIVDTRAAMRAFRGPRGLLAGVRPNALLTCTSLEDVAWEVCRSASRTDQPNPGMESFLKSQGLALYSHDFLDTGIGAETGVTAGDANNWFMLDTRKAADDLLVLVSQPMEVFGDGNLMNGTRNIGGYARYSIGAKTGLWIYGHQVT